MVESRFNRFMRAAGPLPIVTLVAIFGLALVLAARHAGRAQKTLRATLGDLKPVHAGVSLHGERVAWLRRLVSGDRVQTDAEGRARVRLDDGLTAVIDRDTRVDVGANGLTLDAGRLHVTNPVGVRSEIGLGAFSAVFSGATAGFEQRDGKASVYAVSGELTVRRQGKELRVRAGETARFDGAELEVRPERAYDDWTYGLSRPWSAQASPRRALAELWGVESGNAAGTVGSPLTLRSHRVNAVIERELAYTTSETKFFNGGSTRLDGDFRMALPPGALVTAAALTRAGVREVAHVALASRTEVGKVQEASTIEWAGDGWLRGRLSGVEPGQELTLSITYSEWLTQRPNGKNFALQYRYPLVGEGEAPRIGEFSARVDASQSSPLSLGAGYGATNDGHVAIAARSEFRPSADFVVDVEARRTSNRARLYVAPPDEAGAEASSAVLLRAELPAAAPSDGVTLALIVDTSGSIDPALLEAERALVEALVGGLGVHDRVVVLSSDQRARAVGPGALGAVDGARRKAISTGLAALAPGGASDLGRALEAAADALPADVPAAMVIYVGDGWPTLGDTGAEAIRSRLARRANGAPRLAAVAAGPLANRRMLSALTQGSGPLFEIADSADAARVAIELLSDALRPALTAVELDLGAEVDQVYPRGARAVPAGETLTVVGRIRGEAPRSVKIRYRDARGVHEETRELDVLRPRDPAEIRRRWASARVEEIVLRGKGREAATDVALRAGLLTPWTALKFGAASEYVPTRLEARALDLSSDGVSAIGPVLATPEAPSGTLAAFEANEAEGDLTSALVTAARRAIDHAAASVRACRDSRVALRPELSGQLEVTLEVDGDGLPHQVRVRGTTADAEDAALDRCVALVIEALRFPATQSPGRVKVEHIIALPPPPPALGPRRCSEVSKLAMPLRRGAWWSRLAETEASAVYRDAKRQCELSTWTDRRALIELLLIVRASGVERVDLARRLEQLGESDAAALIRREVVRRVQTPAELSAVREALLGDERYPGTVFEQRYKAVASDAARLEVVARFLEFAPHDSRLRRRQVALLDALGRKPELSELTRQLLSDPFADAELLCDAASALHRAGLDEQARRTFGELAERAPRDPWVRGLLGDRLRREGWFDDATAAYAVLEELVPRDARAALRAALAHAGAGRLDVAERLLLRVAETGGRAGDADLGELARHLGRALASEALSGKNAPDALEAQRLRRVVRELSQSETDNVLLVRAEGPVPDLKILLQSGTGLLQESRPPDVASPSLGLYLYRVSGESNPLASHKLTASRPAELAPVAPTLLRVDALFGPATALPSHESEQRALPSDGKTVEFSGG